MQIGIPAEIAAGETRVAATPETVKKYVALGYKVVVQSGAGVASSCVDKAYEEAGAAIADILEEAGARTARGAGRRAGAGAAADSD